MEAVPRLPMISFVLKASHENVSFGPKLKQYISEFYHEDPESYNNEIHQLEGLRSAAVRPAIDLTGCAALKRYFCQLRSLQSRFPMSKGQPAAVSFSWVDLFANIVCTLADVRFEMVCVLYNIGALHCKLGAEEERTTPESMKAACMHFQSAVWAFQHLKDHFPQPSGVDLSPEIMKLFQDICLAQAQECILEKSMQDSRKPAIVGKIGMQVLLYYRSALTALESSQFSANLHETIGIKTCNSWIKTISFKVSYITCIVYLFQGMQSEEQQRMGERVAYYQAACDYLQEARKLTKGMSNIELINDALTFTNDVVEGKRKAAKNENEFIYHEEVPDKDVLTEPKPASLAKGIPVNFNDPDVSGPDIFGRLVPMGAHEASSMYSEEKAKLLREIGASVEAKDIQLTDFMSSLQLDQLDIFDQPERLPQDLVDRCASLSVKTDAIQNLVETMNNLADIHTDVETMLTDIKGMIQEEEANEKQYQQVMGARPPSIVSTELAREANKYQEAHNKANESNQTLHKAMTVHLANLRVLSLPLKEIESQVPSLNSIKDNVDMTAMAEMKTLLAKVNEMQTQRAMFLMQFREAVNSDDITSQLLTRPETLDEIFKQELEKHSKQVNLLKQNMLAQENILKAVTDAYAKYATTRKMVSEVSRKREVFLTALITSFDTYEDLLSKSLKGIEFYRKLSGNVSKLLTRVKSTCKVQEEERSQLLANNSSRQALAASKAIPASDTPLNNDPISTAPKLKDFLPFMKNRNAGTVPPVADSSNLDTSYSGHLYPPYVRPAPVGSEANNESLPSKYTDSTYSDQQTYQTDYDKYKGYQYIQQATGQYTVHQYSEQPPAYSYDGYDNTNPNQEGKATQNTANYPYYQPYNPADSYNASNTNVPQSSEGVSYQQGLMSPSAQYNQTGMSAYTTASNTVYDSYGRLSEQGANQVVTPSNYNPNQMNNQQNFAGYPPPAYSETPQPESTANAYASDITSKMQNMGINYYNNVTTNPNLAYGVSANTNQQYEMPPSYSQSTELPPQSNPYLSSTQHTNTATPVYSQLGSGTYSVNANQIPNNNTLPQANYSHNSQVNNPSIPEYTTSTINYPNQDVGNQSYGQPLSSANQYNVVPPNQHSINTLPQPYDGMQSQSAYAQTHQSIATDPYNLPGANVQPTQELMPQVSDGASIQSHVQRQFLPNSTNPGIPQIQYSNIQYSTPGNAEVNSAVSQQQYANPDPNAYYQQQHASYQSHPGYVYNAKTGVYDYNYGYQNSANTTQALPFPNIEESQSQHNLYTSAGTYGTVQTNSATNTPSESQPPASTDSNGHYYTLPYGHQNAGPIPETQQMSKPEVADANDQRTADNQTPLTYVNSNDTKTITTPSSQGRNSITSSTSIDEAKIKPEEEKKEVSSIDLLSGLDFSVEQKPLMPEIKVPPVSEHVIRKASVFPSTNDKVDEATVPKTEAVNLDVDWEITNRPAKQDLFSDPSLLNKFTQEVKSLQMFVDGLTKKTHSGITMLDSKWKKIQDAQAKDNHSKSLQDAKSNILKNASPDVLTYDHSRVLVKTDSHEGYINASKVQQISPWCIPMIVSDLPSQENIHDFWLMVNQQKVSVIVCLLSEMELQGNFYGPTAKNQQLDCSPDLSVTLEEIICNVNWTERKLVIKYKQNEHKVSHYQISVFPARVVSGPLVQLVDKVLNLKEENPKDDKLPKVLVHCSSGAGRSALIVILTMVMCQVRAGFVDLRDTLDNGFLYLCGTRTNVLEDTKYLVDIYRTVLFYVQGVLCSGTVSFNGEAVSVPSGASIPPPHIPSSSRPQPSDNLSKFSKESFEEMKQAAGLKSGDMKDPLSYLDPLWSLKKRKE